MKMQYAYLYIFSMVNQFHPSSHHQLVANTIAWNSALEKIVRSFGHPAVMIGKDCVSRRKEGISPVPAICHARFIQNNLNYDTCNMYSHTSMFVQTRGEKTEPKRSKLC